MEPDKDTQPRPHVRVCGTTKVGHIVIKTWAETKNEVVYLGGHLIGAIGEPHEHEGAPCIHFHYGAHCESVAHFDSREGALRWIERHAEALDAPLMDEGPEQSQLMPLGGMRISVQDLFGRQGDS